MSEIKRVEQKIDIFIDSQKDSNERVAGNLEKLTDMVVKTQIQQVEINNIAINVNRLSGKIDGINEDLNGIKTNQALTTDFKTQVRQLKWVSIGALFAVVVALSKVLLIP